MLTVGEILKKQREKKGYSLSQIEREIKVREKFLASIEANDWKDFSSKVYISGIIKNYAKYLGIDHQKALAYFYRDYEKKEEIRFKEKISDSYLTPQTKKTFLFILVFIFGLFFVYFGYQLKLFLTPPKVVISAPQATVFKKEDAIRISGKTEPEAIVTIAGERVYLNDQGIFEFNYPLKSGENLVTIEVIGANGKKTTIQKKYYKQEEIKK